MRQLLGLLDPDPIRVFACMGSTQSLQGSCGSDRAEIAVCCEHKEAELQDFPRLQEKGRPLSPMHLLLPPLFFQEPHDKEDG